MKTTTSKKTKVSAKVTSNVSEEVLNTGYNKYGVCIACQGGVEDCMHQNLVEENGQSVCKLCGLVM